MFIFLILIMFFCFYTDLLLILPIGIQGSLIGHPPYTFKLQLLHYLLFRSSTNKPLLIQNASKTLISISSP